MGDAEYPDDHFAFLVGVVEGTDLVLRVLPGDRAVRVETQDFAAILGDVHPLHRVLEDVDAILRALDHLHARMDCMHGAAFELSVGEWSRGRFPWRTAPPAARLRPSETARWRRTPGSRRRATGAPARWSQRSPRRRAPPGLVPA